jgi:hypothetical protein
MEISLTVAWWLHRRFRTDRELELIVSHAFYNPGPIICPDRYIKMLEQAEFNIFHMDNLHLQNRGLVQ